MTPRHCAHYVAPALLGLLALVSLGACEGEVDSDGAQRDAAAGEGGEDGSGSGRDGGGGSSGGGSGGGEPSGGNGGSGGSGGNGAMDGGGGDAAQTAGDSGAEDAAQDAGPSGETRAVIVSSGANHSLALSIDDGLTWCRTSFDETYVDNEDFNVFDNPHLLRNVTYANGWFVSGSMRALFRSQNGYDWQDVTSDQDPALGNWIGQVEFGNGYWVATGGYGTAMRSTDMLDWEDVSSELPGEQASRSLAFGSGVFVTGRDDAGWWQSADGTGWTQINPTGTNRVYYDGAEFAEWPGYDCLGQLCLQGNWDGTLLRSTDGGESFSDVEGTADLMVGQRFAFGRAPVEDFEPGADIDPDVRSCLGL